MEKGIKFKNNKVIFDFNKINFSIEGNDLSITYYNKGNELFTMDFEINKHDNFYLNIMDIEGKITLKTEST